MLDKNLGDYKLLKQIGQGSLGTVYLAEHRFIKKTYVLKVLPPELASDRGFVERFEEEVGRLATLDHPHIVKVHNVSFIDGAYFLVTDCVVDSIGETTNLAQYMAGRKERLREEDLYSILHQVADALNYVHSKKGGEPVIHRSLKLNNILIGQAKPGIEVFLSDFGLAKVIGPGAVVARTFKAMADALGSLPYEVLPKTGEERYAPFPFETHANKLSKLTHSFLQNFAFLAPEQKRLQPTGIEVDIYAFGVLAYYLITGVFPEGTFEMPSLVAKEYTYDWDHLISECLHFRPENRRTDLNVLLEEITKGKSELSLPPLRKPPEEKREMPNLEKMHSTLTSTSSHTAIQEDRELIAASVLPNASSQKAEDKGSTVIFRPYPKAEGGESIMDMMHRDPVVKEYHPEKKERCLIEPLLTGKVVIPGGQYYRGSNEGNRDEMPRHQIYLNSFAIDIHPVTNEQFVRFLEYMGGEKDQNYNDLIRLKDSRMSRSAGRLNIESGYAKHPVVGVTWFGAMGYAKWVDKRLPTEAEWEIAALGGLMGSLYPTGNNIEKNQANFFSSDTTPVMSYAANGYGLYDMVGNVYEWCQDWYGYNYYEASAVEPNQPKGPIQGVYRVLRGGCWKSLKEDLRISHRHRNNPNAVNGTYGFRCCSDV